MEFVIGAGPCEDAIVDEAETVLTGLAVKLGAEPASLTTITALRVVEEIRAGVLERGACG